MDWSAARHLPHSSVAPLPVVTPRTNDALGATLATPLTARLAHPPHDTAAMDGYAVTGQAPWQVVDRVMAGQVPRGPLGAGQAVEIATGAMVPDGTDSVLPYEHATRSGDVVKGTVPSGRHVRRSGEEVPAGTELAPVGTRVTPTVLALAASAGHDTIAVHPRPRVAVVVTGDELVHEGIPGSGRIRDAIGPMMPGLVTWMGAELTGVDHVPDTGDALRSALAAEADVVVTTGASSVGARDQLPRVLTELSAELLVNGVACRPGHPQLLARLGDRHVVGMPGNPLAALVAAVTLLDPLVRALAARPIAPLAEAAVSGEVTSHERMTRLVPVEVEAGWASPVGRDRPGMIWGAALADALAVVPPGWDGRRVGLLPLPPR
ncbi:molybdopterin molybdenumtransferase MoeA [Halostreptopolyspora alba]|uniref:Molybdopterin molybdenumtransferase n=2 Tax=Halostreptopolyspora alba TaxID=2487137 RepID=A0A3N0E4D3_9ACTN|nr:molybdopterin molybdenumtransferase MoeA [Nocardiopsaceae bacterium YIM 96095]